MSVDQESSVETIGRNASEDPDRIGTAKVWTSSSESEFSTTMGGGPEAAGVGTGGGLEGPATGEAGAAWTPRASLTWVKKPGNCKRNKGKKLNKLFKFNFL